MIAEMKQGETEVLMAWTRALATNKASGHSIVRAVAGLGMWSDRDSNLGGNRKRGRLGKCCGYLSLLSLLSIRIPFFYSEK